MKPHALSALGRRIAEPPISWLMRAALARPGFISLAAGFTDNPSLPAALSRRLLNDLLRSPKSAQPALQYGLTPGELNLRRLTGGHLTKLDGQAALPPSGGKNVKTGTMARWDEIHSPERLMITGGSQQLLYMTVEALCDPGDIVLVEDPTYFVFLGLLQSHGVRARGVKLERDGLDLLHLESVLERLCKSGELDRVKALYLVSYFQNPTGVTTSFAKKAGILELLRKFGRAAGHPIFLLEDAAYRELRFAGADVPSSLLVRGAADRVVYTGTYSKPFAPGARVGFGILPEPLFATVQRIKGNHDFGTANLLQQLLARALETGLYDRHVAKIQRRYAQKARVMKQALAECFPSDVEIWESGGGLYFWARLPEDNPTGVKSKVFQTALTNGVLYVPGQLCYADEPARAKPDHEMRLSFGSASEENIREGIRRLGRVLRNIPGRKARPHPRMARRRHRRAVAGKGAGEA
ncbi:MAG: PLP-dependent aminotransferase family protein [Verrucomicrobiota bacterium]|nr:PLP-dependent aminotransferase family protein [Verrucomicrobiota bacterium]